VSRRNDAPQRITNLAFYGMVLLIGYLAYRIVQPFLVEIGWAVVLAICLAPLRSRLAARVGPTRAALILTVVSLFLLILPAAAAAAMLVREGPQAIAYVDGQLRDRGGPMGLFHLVWSWLQARLPLLPTEEEVIERATSSLGDVARHVVSNAGSVLKGAASFAIGLAITLGIMFFLLKDAVEMERAARRLLPFGREQNQALLTLTRDIVSASVTSMLAVAIIQGLIGWITFVLLGVQGATLWAGLLAVLSLLPAVGGALVWAPAAIWLAVSGSLVKGVILALVGLLILGNVDNVVRPWLLSGTARMSTLVLLISLLGGVSAFGFIGIVLGPVVAAVLTALVESYHLVDEEEPEAAAAPAEAARVTVVGEAAPQLPAAPQPTLPPEPDPPAPSSEPPTTR
jgi:predicted PurR-regulated permease PerM